MNYSRLSFLLFFLFVSLFTTAQGAVHECAGMYKLEGTLDVGIEGGVIDSTEAIFGSALVTTDGYLEVMWSSMGIININSVYEFSGFPISSSGTFNSIGSRRSITGSCSNGLIQGALTARYLSRDENSNRLNIFSSGTFTGQRADEAGAFNNLAGLYRDSYDDPPAFINASPTPGGEVKVMVFPDGLVHIVHLGAYSGYNQSGMFDGLGYLNENGQASFEGTLYSSFGLPYPEIVEDKKTYSFTLTRSSRPLSISFIDGYFAYNSDTHDFGLLPFEVSLSTPRRRGFQTSPAFTDGDFNQDGNADVLWRDHASGSVWIYLMNGAEITQSFNIDYVDTFLEIVGLGDFNDDTQTDILWRNSQTGTIQVTLMADTTVVSATSFDLFSDLFWFIAGVGDFDGSGTDDILWRRSDTGEFRITYFSGGSPSYPGDIPSTGLEWDVSAIGDFNGDGSDDILWRNHVDGHVWMYQLYGGTVFDSGTHVAYTSLTWDIKDVGDFNGDGMDDILWRNKESGRVWTYYMNGPSIINGSASNPGEHVTFSSVVWDIKKVDDFNGDGKDDIFWRNDTTGENWIYLMDGVSITQEQSVSTVSDPNWNIVD